MKVKKIEGFVAFGIMDGIVTLIGILLAMLALDASQKVILASAFAAAIADSVANAAGYHVSEEAARKNHSIASHSSVYCLLATFVAMLVPLIPIIVLQPPLSIYVAVAIGLVVLFLLGVFIKNWKIGIEYLLIGGVAGIVCYLIGFLA